MRIKTYNEVVSEILEQNSPYYYQGLNALRELLPLLSEKYRVNPDISSNIEGSLFNSLPTLFHLTKGDLRGKRIIDLGCGSRTSRENFSGGVLYEPWLCRALFELGANPVGIDINDNSGEQFESYKIDLNQSRSLDFLQRNYFDLANIRGLFTSLNFRLGNTDPRERIFPQLERIVKLEGTLLYTEDF